MTARDQYDQKRETWRNLFRQKRRERMRLLGISFWMEDQVRSKFMKDSPCGVYPLRAGCAPPPGLWPSWPIRSDILPYLVHEYRLSHQDL